MLWFWSYKTFTTRWSGGKVQVWVQVCVIWQSLWRAVPEGNRRFREQNQRPSSWGSSPALLARVRRASTNTGCFLVCCSRCWQWQARLRKTCYHFCYTDSVQVFKSQQGLMLCKFQAAASHFLFSCEMKISMELVRSCCQPKQLPLLRSLFL